MIVCDIMCTLNTQHTQTKCLQCESCKHTQTQNFYVLQISIVLMVVMAPYDTWEIFPLSGIIIKMHFSPFHTLWVFALLQPVLLSILCTTLLYYTYLASPIFSVQLFRQPKLKYMHLDNQRYFIPDAQKDRKCQGIFLHSILFMKSKSLTVSSSLFSLKL